MGSNHSSDARDSKNGVSDTAAEQHVHFMASVLAADADARTEEPTVLASKPGMPLEAVRPPRPVRPGSPSSKSNPVSPQSSLHSPNKARGRQKTLQNMLSYSEIDW